jgi:hypothetical protein
MIESKKIVKIVIVLSVLLIGGIVIGIIFISNVPQESPNNNQEQDMRTEKLAEVHNVTVIIDYSDENSIDKFDNISLFNNNTTTFDALNKTSQVQYEDYGFGLYVTEINGVGEGWIYKVNDEMPPVPANEYNLRDNDKVEWTHV